MIPPPEQNRCYEKIITTHRGNIPHLEVDIRSTLYPDTDGPGASVYYVPLLILAQSELNLDQYRFLYYVPEEQPHVVPWRITSRVDEHFHERIEWIYANVMNSWSFDLRMRHVSDGVFYWSFENADDALLFKLTF